MVIRSRQTFWATIFSVQRLDEFMWKEALEIDAGRLIDQTAFRDAVVARFVMLQTEVCDIITKRNQEMIVAVMSRPEERPRFGDKLMKMHLHVRRHRQSGGAVCRDIHLVRRICTRRELYHAKIAPCDHRRINQCVERDRREL